MDSGNLPQCENPLATAEQIDVDCDIQMVLKEAKSDTVRYPDHCFSANDGNDSDTLERRKFSIDSEYQLCFYDCIKHIIGVEAASRFPKSFVNIEGNTIPLPVDPGSKSLCGALQYVFKPNSYVKVNISDVQLCHAALELLERIKQVSQDERIAMAKEFVKQFKCHFVIGEGYVGSLVEWVIFHSPSLNKKLATHLTTKLFKAIETIEGSKEGNWYHGKDILKVDFLNAMEADALQSYKVRITKYGDIYPAHNCLEHKLAATAQNEIPLSVSEPFQIIPVWKKVEDRETVTLLKNAYEEKKAVKQKSVKNDSARSKAMRHILSQCIKHEDGSVIIYELKTKQIPTEFNKDFNENKEKGQYMMEKYQIGSQHPTAPKPEKVIMIMGATGSGKTTLINSLVNYIYGVDYDDDFRFKLVMEGAVGEKKNQALSQTTNVTSYTMHHQEYFNVPFTVTLIDTPGFGDTGGIMKDKEITEKIKTIFSCEDGIGHIDVIGFVAQSSLARLTSTQQYIFDSILSLFGKDIASNIVMLLTFADCHEPQILDGLKEARLPYNSYFKFNNSAIFAHNTDACSAEGKMNLMFWDLGMESFRTFMSKVKEIAPASLMLTKNVLDKRSRLENYIQAIQQDIQRGLSYLDQLAVQTNVLKQHEHDIEQNKDFEYEVTQQRVEVKKVSGIYTTNCLVCKRTCHASCTISADNEKRKCTIMGSGGNCTICSRHCHWKLHKNQPFIYTIVEFKEKRTSNDLKQRYQDAFGKRLIAKQKIKKISQDFDKVQVKVIAYTEDVRKSLKRLHEIALKPNPLSTTDYIDILIDSEKSQARQGWQARVDQLQGVRKEAEYMMKVASDGFDPFAEYKVASDGFDPFAEYKKKNAAKKYKGSGIASKLRSIGLTITMNYFKD